MDYLKNKGIFLSIKPIHMNRIASGIKNHEFRTKIPNEEPNILYVYETTPTCALKYILYVDKIIKYPNQIEIDGYGNDDFNKGLKSGKYAYHIKHVDKLDKPISLNELKNKFGFTAPQGFAYDTRYPDLVLYINNESKTRII